MTEKPRLNTSPKNQAPPNLSFSTQLAKLLSQFDINKFKEDFEKTKKDYLQYLSNKLSILFSNNSTRKEKLLNLLKQPSINDFLITKIIILQRH
jgi:hypothetical protein